MLGKAQFLAGNFFDETGIVQEPLLFVTEMGQHFLVMANFLLDGALAGG